MTQQLRFIPFRSRSDKGWAEAWALYEASFPDCERWDGTGYDRAFGDPHFEADGIWRGDEFIGILFHWNAGDYHYVEHLAVSPPDCGDRTWDRKPSRLFAKGGASSWRSTRRRMKSRSAASISTSGWASSPIPTSTSTPRSGGRSTLIGWC